MLSAAGSIFDTSGFVARWDCGDWTALHGWTHIVSDTLIFLAYAAIPISLAIVAWRAGKRLPFGGVIWLFVAFIASCGLTHLIEAVIFFEPIYRVSAAMKVVTAVVSWATVFALMRVVPGVLALPELKLENDELRRWRQTSLTTSKTLARSHEELKRRNMTLSQSRRATEQALRSAGAGAWRVDPGRDLLEVDLSAVLEQLRAGAHLNGELSAEQVEEQVRSAISAMVLMPPAGSSGRYDALLSVAPGVRLMLVGGRDYPKTDVTQASGLVLWVRNPGVASATGEPT